MLSKWQVNKLGFHRLRDSRPATPGHTFLHSKKKIGKQRGKKERISRQKLLKGCRQGQNVTVLAILECLEFKNFSCHPTMVADNTFQCSMALHFKIHFAGPEIY